LAESVEEGFIRSDARIDRLTERMESGFARMDTRINALMTAITSTRIYPDTLSARLDSLEREV